MVLIDVGRRPDGTTTSRIKWHPEVDRKYVLFLALSSSSHDDSGGVEFRCNEIYWPNHSSNDGASGFGCDNPASEFGRSPSDPGVEEWSSDPAPVSSEI